MNEENKDINRKTNEQNNNRKCGQWNKKKQTDVKSQSIKGERTFTIVENRRTERQVFKWIDRQIEANNEMKRKELYSYEVSRSVKMEKWNMFEFI